MLVPWYKTRVYWKLQEIFKSLLEVVLVFILVLHNGKYYLDPMKDVF